MIHYMNLNNLPFIHIKSKYKDIEMRLFDEKRKLIKVGDVIEFKNNSTNETLKAVVLKLHQYPSFDYLYEKFDQKRLGYEENEKANPMDMEQYYSKEKIIKFGVLGIQICIFTKLTPEILMDNGICPTCFNRDYDNFLYGKNEDKLIYEDEILECILDSYPKAEGHILIITKQHFKDMIALPDDINLYVYNFAKKMMNIIKKVYQSESVYLCTMCDGLMNHFHIHLIPRYKEEKRGSVNFVKNRKPLMINSLKLEELRKLIKM